jgi:hypothetical protein
MNGVCHWLSMPRCHWTVPYSAEACMVSFDLNKETFFVTPIPSYVRLTWTQLTVLNNSIALIFFPTNTNIFHISILGEVGVKESWIKLFTVEKPCALSTFPIGVGMNGEIVFANDDNKLLLFDLNTDKIVELGLKRRDRLTLGRDSAANVAGHSSANSGWTKLSVDMLKCNVDAALFPQENIFGVRICIRNAKFEFVQTKT